MSLTCSLEAIQVGDWVRFIIRLTNNGSEILELPRGSNDQAEVSLRREGAELWRWTTPITTNSGQKKIVPPGQTTSWEAAWSDPLFGMFTAVGTITVGETILETETPVTITKALAGAEDPPPRR